MGGELLLLALGGCFLSNLLAAARARETSVHAIQIIVQATLEEVPERMTRFLLKVSGHYEDRVQMEKLVAIAERGCIVANTLRGTAPIDIELADSLPR